MNHLYFAILLGFAFAGCNRQSSTTSLDGTISVPSEDPIMNHAIEQARSSLPYFWHELKTHPNNENSFNLKVLIEDADQIEHFWCSDILINSDRVSGVINNDPEFVHTVRLGQRVEIDPKMISDWMFIRNGKIVGNYTVRALFPKMSPEEVSVMKVKLADLPDTAEQGAAANP